MSISANPVARSIDQIVKVPRFRLKYFYEWSNVPGDSLDDQKREDI